MEFEITQKGAIYTTLRTTVTGVHEQSYIAHAVEFAAGWHENISSGHNRQNDIHSDLFSFIILVQFFVKKLYCDIQKVIGKLLQFRKVHVLWAQNQSTKLESDSQNL